VIYFPGKTISFYLHEPDGNIQTPTTSCLGKWTVVAVSGLFEPVCQQHACTLPSRGVSTLRGWHDHHCNAPQASGTC